MITIIITALAAVIFKSFKLKIFFMTTKDSYLKRRIVMRTLAFYEFVGVVKLVGKIVERL